MMGHGWMVNYLNLHKAYVHPGVVFDNIEYLDFYTPNIEKTSREKSTFKFPPFFRAENPIVVVEVIMIYWKKGYHRENEMLLQLAFWHLF